MTLFGGVAVTAVDFSRYILQGTANEGHLIAFGAENGSIVIVSLNADNDIISDDNALGTVRYNVLATVPTQFAHGATVKRLRWKPNPSGLSFELASCGDDHTVRVFQFQF